MDFDSGQVNMKDEQRCGLPLTSADPLQDVDAAVQVDRCISIA
jgi:hypothetical protein